MGRREEKPGQAGTRLAQIEAIVAPRIAPLGLEVVVVEQTAMGRETVVRISIDRLPDANGVVSGAVTLADCVKVTHLLNEVSELEDLMPGAFHLEVSSPGVERPLVRERDYHRFMGEKVQVNTFEPVSTIEGRKKFTGRLVGLSEGHIRVDLGREGEVLIPLSQIQKAHLKPDFADLMKRANSLQAQANPDGALPELDSDELDLEGNGDAELEN